jgi:hypothetical protein
MFDLNKLTDAVPEDMKEKAKEACQSEVEELKNNAMSKFGLGGNDSKSPEAASGEASQGQSAGADAQSQSDVAAQGQTDDAAQQSAGDAEPVASDQDDDSRAA